MISDERKENLRQAIIEDTIGWRGIEEIFKEIEKLEAIVKSSETVIDCMSTHLPVSGEAYSNYYDKLKNWKQS